MLLILEIFFYAFVYIENLLISSSPEADACSHSIGAF